MDTDATSDDLVNRLAGLGTADFVRYDVIWRGDDQQSTTPIVELGRAIISLLRGDLSGDASGIDCIYGTPEGAHRL